MWMNCCFYSCWTKLTSILVSSSPITIHSSLKVFNLPFSLWWAYCNSFLCNLCQLLWHYQLLCRSLYLKTQILNTVIMLYIQPAQWSCWLQHHVSALLLWLAQKFHFQLYHCCHVLARDVKISFLSLSHSMAPFPLKTNLHSIFISAPCGKFTGYFLLPFTTHFIILSHLINTKHSGDILHGICPIVVFSSVISSWQPQTMGLWDC